MRKLCIMIAKALLIVFFFLACHKNNRQIYLPQYFPNAVGDSWVYDVTDSAQSTPNNPSPPLRYSVKVVITGTKVLLDGIGASVWQYQYPWGNDTNFVRITGDTVKIFSLTYSRSLDDLNYPQVIFLLPFQINNRWDGKLLNIDSSRVISQSEVTIPSAQTYSNCLEIYHHYIGPNTEFNDYYWFKANVGMVSIYYNDNNNGPVLYRTWLLKTYYLH
jgi:hypothetical protein